MKVIYKIGNKSFCRDDFVATGKSDGISEIIKSREFPGLHTDDEFMANRGTLASQLGDQLDDVVKAAKRNGYTPSTNDVYLPSAARFVGDPEAFVKHDSAKGTLKRTLEKRGWACDGSIKVKGRQDEVKPVKLASDIVDREVAALKRAGKVPEGKDIGELRHEIIERHGSKE